MQQTLKEKHEINKCVKVCFIVENIKNELIEMVFHIIKNKCGEICGKTILIFQ